MMNMDNGPFEAVKIRRLRRVTKFIKRACFDWRHFGKGTKESIQTKVTNSPA